MQTRTRPFYDGTCPYLHRSALARIRFATGIAGMSRLWSARRGQYQWTTSLDESGRGSARRVRGEENASGERVQLHCSSGVNERTKARRPERGRIGADLVRCARRAVLGIFEVADEIVVGKRRQDEHRGIQRDAEPFHDRHGLLDHLPTKDNPDTPGDTAEIVFPTVF